MSYLDEISYNTLFQVNATILVGLFILISLLPAVFKDLADIQLFEQLESIFQQIVNEAHVFQNSSSKIVQQLRLLNTANLTDAQRSLLPDIINKENRIIQYNDQLIELSTEGIVSKTEEKELTGLVNELWRTQNAYFITYGLMSPFIFSIFSILIHQYRVAKYSTFIGLGLVVIVVISFGIYVHRILDDAQNELGIKIRADTEIAKRSADISKNMSILLDNLSSQYSKLVSPK